MEVEENFSTKDLQKDLMATQEVRFAKVLAGNEKKLRDRGIKKLRKWLSTRAVGKNTFTEEDFQRIWTGLFYCMWMSDKPLIQEEVAESISNLVHCFEKNNDAALLFIKCFNKLMLLEWPGIDQHRLDKFSMLTRRFLRQSLEFCRKKEWSNKLIKRLISIFEEVILNPNHFNGYTLHFVDIYPEELAKVSRGKLSEKIVLLFFELFLRAAGKSNDLRFQKAISLLFTHLINQTDIGIEYEHKVNAWKQQGFPCKSPDALTKITLNNDSDDEISDEDEINLDPRAGNVNSLLPQIPIDFEGMMRLIKKYLDTKPITSSGKNNLKCLFLQFDKLKKGKMPEKIIKPSILNEVPGKRRHTLKCAKELIKFNEKLQRSTSPFKLNELNDLDDWDENCVQKYLKGNKPEIRRKKKSKQKIGKETNKFSVAHNLKKKKLSKNVRSLKVNEKTLKQVARDENVKLEAAVGKNPQKNSQSEVTEIAKRSDEKLKKPHKPKSVNAFQNEKIKQDSGNLKINHSRKRKALSPWQMHELSENAEEPKKNIAKVVKLEKNVVIPFSTEKDGPQKEVETKSVPNSKKVEQRQITPVFWEKAKAKVEKTKKSKTRFLNPFYSGEDQPKNSKRISFALDRNVAQGNEEYLEEVKNSPRIPFDGSKKPVHSALKSGLTPSPINPFYRFGKK